MRLLPVDELRVLPRYRSARALTKRRVSRGRCEVLPAMTRFGVMKHLAVLEAARLVVAHKVGRAKLHYLNPVPIQEIHERWISKYAAPTVEAMVGLRRQLETATA